MSFLNLFISWRYIKGKGKTLFNISSKLSFLGVFVGTSLLVTVLSIFNGFQDQIKKSIFKFEPHLLIMNPFGDSKVKKWETYIERIKKNFYTEIESVEGMINSPVLIRLLNQVEHVFLRGQFFEDMGNSWKLPSNFPKIIEPAKMSHFKKGYHCLIGKEMAVNLALHVGDTIELIVPQGQFSLKMGVTPRIKSFEIAGFFKTGHYQYDSKVVILSLETAQSLFAIKDSVQQVAIRLNNIDNIDRFRDKLYTILPFSYHVRTIEDEQKNFFAALKLEKTVMTIIVSLFVIAAMIGIVIATYSIIHSKRREIGILKAIGLSRLNILSIFILNGFMMGFLGTFCGIIFGLFLAINMENLIFAIEFLINLVGNFYMQFHENDIWDNVEIISKDTYYFDHLPIHFDLATLHTLSVFSIILSSVASFVPALYASKIEPIEVIRNSK